MRGAGVETLHLHRLFWAGVEILDGFVVLDGVRYDGEVCYEWFTLLWRHSVSKDLGMRV